MMVLASYCGGVAPQQGQGHFSGTKGQWMEQNTDKSKIVEKVVCSIMLLFAE